MVNAVTPYVDGVGNKVNAIQWDGDATGTLPVILAWSKKVTYAAGVLRIQTPFHLKHVGSGDWLVMDSHRFDQVFPMTNPQFTATYAAPSP